MPASAAALPREQSQIRFDPGAWGAWALGLLLPLYLALEGGGFDPVLRGQVGIAVWWGLALAFATGVLSLAGVGRLAWAALGLLVAFIAWSLLGATWSESAERAVAESSRLAFYLGVLVLGLWACRRGHWRHVVSGLATAIVCVAAVAVLSRAQPAWFDDRIGEFLPGARPRLSYPLNYWNALAALMALGIPLLLALGTHARTATVRAVATGAVPLLVACLYLTLSRGGAIAATLGVLCFLVLSRRPGRSALVVALAAGGGAILVGAVEQRDAMAEALTSATALRQGDEFIVLVAFVCVGVALLRGAFALAEKHRAGPFAHSLSNGRAQLGLRALVTLAVAVAVATIGLAGGGQDRLDEAWRNFKSPSAGLEAGANLTSARFGSTSGNGRYQFWASAARASESETLRGRGAGSFEFWLARDREVGREVGFARNAHSLVAETLAETGIVGLALLLGLLGAALAAGLVAVHRARGRSGLLLPGVVAGMVAFVFSASTDWVWQVPAVPVCFFLLAACVLTAHRDRVRRSDPGGKRIVERLALTAACLAAIVLLAIPLTGVLGVRASQAETRQGELAAALDELESAERAQPYAGSPALQRALVHERAGRLDAAAAAARGAIDHEPTNWRNHLILARIEAERGRADAAVAAFRRAQALNPRNTLFD